MRRCDVLKPLRTMTDTTRYSLSRTASTPLANRHMGRVDRSATAKMQSAQFAVGCQRGSISLAGVNRAMGVMCCVRYRRAAILG